MGFFGSKSKYYDKTEQFTKVLSGLRSKDFFTLYDSTKSAIVHLNEYYAPLQKKLQGKTVALNASEIDDVTSNLKLVNLIITIVGDNAVVYANLEKWVAEAKKGKLLRKNDSDILNYCDKPLNLLATLNSNMPELLRRIKTAQERIIALGKNGTTTPEGKTLVNNMLQDILISLKQLLDRLMKQQTNLKELEEAFSVLPSEDVKKMLRVEDWKKVKLAA